VPFPGTTRLRLLVRSAGECSCSRRRARQPWRGGDGRGSGRRAVPVVRQTGPYYWVVGGWGVDALLGRCTREHKDLDVLLVVSQHARAWRLLHDHEYLLAYRWGENVDAPGDLLPGDLLPGEVHPTAYVLEDQSGRQVDVHALDDRWPDLHPLWSTDRKFIPGVLDAQGTIDGVRVRCMSAQMQLVAHEGYELPEAHQVDVVELRQFLTTNRY
jgi:lincosamide nucleotidyltransferase A/C/D/E